jgi:putative hydrolase
VNYVLDSHTHTIASGHAYNTITEMAQAAAEKGMELLGITEHSMEMPGTCHEFYFMNLKVLPREMAGVEMLFGTEVNIMDFEGRIDMREGLLKRMDVVVASLHTPCIKAGTKEENTRAVLKTMEHPLVNIIGHPDDGRYPLDYDAVVRGAKEHRVLLELNNTSLRPGGSRQGARENDIQMLELCRKYNVPIIVNSDAHCMWDVLNFDYADALLTELDFPEELVVNRSAEIYKTYVNRFRI